MSKKPSYQEMRDALMMAISVIDLMLLEAISEEAVHERLTKAKATLNDSWPSSRRK